MQAQHSLIFTSFLVLCAIVSIVQTRSTSSSKDYRGSGRLEVAHRGSGRLEIACRASGRVDAT